MKRVAREIMTPKPECAGPEWTLVQVAELLAEADIGSLPVCDADNRLRGIVTDRDIVVKVVAQGRDPASVTAGELTHGDVISVEADASIHDVLQLMAKHQIRRLPVVEGGKLVGIVSQADIAKNWDEEQVGDLVEAISEE
jgi:CBS domain-containing protein